MTKRLSGLAACGILGLAAWAISASFVYCFGFSGYDIHNDLFRPPYLQWFQAAPWYDYAPEVRRWLVISAAALPLLASLLVVGIWSGNNSSYPRLRGRRPFG